MFGAVMAAGLIGLVLASFFAHLVRFFPPVVTGSIITVFGLSLLPVAFTWPWAARAPPTSAPGRTSAWPG